MISGTKAVHGRINPWGLAAVLAAVAVVTYALLVGAETLPLAFQSERGTEGGGSGGHASAGFCSNPKAHGGQAGARHSAPSEPCGLVEDGSDSAAEGEALAGPVADPSAPAGIRTGPAGQEADGVRQPEPAGEQSGSLAHAQPETAPPPQANAAAPSPPSAAPSPAKEKAPPSQAEMHRHHSFSDVEKYVRMWEDPKRAEWQRPDEVVAALKLKPGQAVADIGAGSGYFSFPFAKAVGPEGKVYAVDIEPGMIEYIRKRAESESTQSLVAVLAAPDDAKLPAGSVDLVFVCNTWHHIDERVAYLKRLTAALKPGARIAIVDYKKEPIPVGPPAETKLDRDEVLRDFAQAGFALAEEPGFLPYQYFLVFTLKN